MSDAKMINETFDKQFINTHSEDACLRKPARPERARSAAERHPPGMSKEAELIAPAAT